VTDGASQAAPRGDPGSVSTTIKDSGTAMPGVPDKGTSGPVSNTAMPASMAFHLTRTGHLHLTGLYAGAAFLCVGGAFLAYRTVRSGGSHRRLLPM